MFKTNFIKDFRLNRHFMIVTAVTLSILFMMNLLLYFLFKNTLSLLIFSFSGLASMLDTIFITFLMYFLLENDLGKNHITYTIFAPQSLLSWFLPKLFYLILFQGVFALFDVVYQLIRENLLPDFHMNTYEMLTRFFTTTFNCGFFALFLLGFGLYYSIRNKKTAWYLIVLAVVIYFLSYLSYDFYQEFEIQLHQRKFDTIPTLFISYGIKNITDLIYLFISYYLYQYKIEY